MTALAEPTPSAAPRLSFIEPGHRVCLVASAGGHLMQLDAMREMWTECDRCWVTFRKEDAESMLEGERTYWAYFPTTRNIPNLLRNLRLAWSILRRERPDVIVSTGAGVAFPFFVLGRLRRCVLVYVEVYDRIDSPTLTGRLCHPLADVFALQWPEQKRFYKRGVVVGPLL